MDDAVKKVLDGFEARAAEERRLISEMSSAEFADRRDEFLLPVGPATGAFINLLAKEAAAKTIVEIGASYGYSTVWLAEAARETGGTVISLELEAHKIDTAREALSQAGLKEWVDFRVGDAQETLEEIAEPVDFALLDVWKGLYIPCFDRLYPKLAADAILVADNMIRPESTRPQAESYRQHIRSKGTLESILLPVGTGLEVSRHIG